MEPISQQASELSDPALQQNVRAALWKALRAGSGTAIVAVGQLNQLQVADLVTNDSWLRVSVEEILAPDAPLLDASGRTGILLTGYSNQLSDTQERWVQGAIRSAFANAYGSDRGRGSVLVVASSLPRTDVFDHKNWWYNGPFQGTNVYQISAQGQYVVLKAFAARGDLRTFAPKQWTEQTSEVLGR